MPFGLATSGYIFSKITREIVNYWRGKGFKIIMYLDDGLGGATCYEEALSTSKIIKSDLEQFGFHIAQEKCIWTPVQKLDWLGFTWNFTEGTLRITTKRIEKLKDFLASLIEKYNSGIVLFKVRFIASIVGQIISTRAMLGDQSRLRTRYTYECILNRINWNSVIMISKEVFGECRFWLDHVDSLNEIGSQLCQLTYNKTHNFHVFCDASEIGFGGHLTTGSEDEAVEIYGSWSREEKAQSSTWRELEAVNRVLRNVINKLNGKFVRVYTDNKNVTHIIRVGSRKNILHSSVIDIHELCMKHSIKLSIVWIPREVNDKADSLSRKSDCDDWEIEDWLFKYLDQLWGVHIP